MPAAPRSWCAPACCARKCMHAECAGRWQTVRRRTRRPLHLPANSRVAANAGLRRRGLDRSTAQAGVTSPKRHALTATTTCTLHLLLLACWPIMHAGLCTPQSTQAEALWGRPTHNKARATERRAGILFSLFYDVTGSKPPSPRHAHSKAPPPTKTRRSSRAARTTSCTEQRRPALPVFRGVISSPSFATKQSQASDAERRRLLGGVVALLAADGRMDGCPLQTSPTACKQGAQRLSVHGLPGLIAGAPVRRP